MRSGYDDGQSGKLYGSRRHDRSRGDARRGERSTPPEWDDQRFASDRWRDTDPYAHAEVYGDDYDRRGYERDEAGRNGHDRDGYGRDRYQHGEYDDHYDEHNAAYDGAYDDEYDQVPGEGGDVAEWTNAEGAGTRIGRRAAKLREKQRRHKDRRRSFGALVVMTVVFVVLAFGGWWGYNKVRDFISPDDYSGSGSGEVTVVIHQGDTAVDIGNTLVESGVVKSAEAFTDAAAADKRSRGLQPGTYKLRKEMKASKALDLLLDPAARISRQFTIPEGKSVRQTFDIIEKAVGVTADDLHAAADDPAYLELPSWIPAEITGVDRLEGFLFPDTYQLEPKMGAKEALKMMVDRAKQEFTNMNLEQSAAAINQSPYVVVQIASLIEGEGIHEDFGKISRVIYNRLDYEPPFLNFDSTTQYWLEKTGEGRKKFLAENDLQNPDNNYSTTRLRGLPPTAISNPGRAALEAALNPEEGAWMYFVLVDENGKSAFATTQAEQDRNVAICREKNLGC